MNKFLKKVPLFADLPEEDLSRLCSLVREEKVPANETLFMEGDLGDNAYVIMEGEIDILKESGDQTVLLATRKAGEVIGEMSLLDQAPRFASGKTRRECKLINISHENLTHLLDTSPSAAKVFLATITNRLRSTELVLRQSEKMAQLGTLTAGIAHELNNPASAARRGSEQLTSEIENIQHFFQLFSTFGFSEEQWITAGELSQYAQQRASMVDDLSSLERSDLEGSLEDWLTGQNIEKGWELAPILVRLGYQISDLESIQDTFPAPGFSAVLTWLCAAFNIYSLLREINQGTSRIGEIVKSLKSYAYLDQAPVQLVNVHEGLDNTLVMLRSKLSPGIVLERDYDKNLPQIMAHGSELNQVWTNIIDNAADAMDGEGRITIRTDTAGDWVIVEIEDSGPGIPENIQHKLFSPFFTTKPVGKGTGLGLNISFNIIQKHHGKISVSSQPGRTSFTVWLPVNFEKMDEDSIPLPGAEQVPDDVLLEILKSTRTIAVVGISSRESAPGNYVPKYLQEQGYKIIPVNPKLDQIFGERSFPELRSLNAPPDLVLIFRRRDYVADIVDQAVEIGAQAIWMQEGIFHPGAAGTARAAGLKVVMDLCIKKTHQRLLGES